MVCIYVECEKPRIDAAVAVEYLKMQVRTENRENEETKSY